MQHVSWQNQGSAAVMYWPSEIGTSVEFGSLVILNIGNIIDKKNRNIHIRELELSIEDNDYVR